jgi:hypothetical protein
MLCYVAGNVYICGMNTSGQWSVISGQQNGMKLAGIKIEKLTMVNNILTRMADNIQVFNKLQILSGCWIFNSLIINRLRGCKKNVKNVLHNSLIVSAYFCLVRILSGFYGTINCKL